MIRIILSTILCLMTSIVSQAENEKVMYHLTGSGITKNTVTFDTTTTKNNLTASNKPKMLTERMTGTLIEKEFGKNNAKQLKRLSKIKTRGAVGTVIGSIFTVTGATLMIVSMSSDNHNKTSTSSAKDVINDAIQTADKKHNQFVVGTICLGLSIPITSIGISKVTYSNKRAEEIFYY